MRLGKVDPEILITLHALATSTLYAPGVNQSDPDLRPLVDAVEWLEEVTPKLMCKTCGEYAVYALDECESCYRYRKRTGEKKSLKKSA